MLTDPLTGGAADDSSTRPHVSVVMPMRNSHDFVGASIRSVIGQSDARWELVVVDDGSTDGSVEVVEAIAAHEPRVRLFRNPGKAGAAHTRNHGITHAKGRYIAFLDSDDMWLPTKLAAQLELFERTRAPLTYTNYYKIDGDDDVEAADYVPTKRVVRAPLRLDYRRMLRQDYIGFLTAMYDTQLLGKRYFPELTRRQDYAMLLEVLRDGHEARGLEEPLALYRAGRSGSLSANKFRVARYNWHIYRHVEKLPLPRASIAFANYAVRSTLKYFI